MSGPNQFDIPLYGLNSDARNVPRYMPGVLSALDFVHFRWPCRLDSKISDYQVTVESLDVSGPTYKSISSLKKSVQLPHTHFDSHARIGLVPKNRSLPVFEARLVRGSTYVITDDMLNAFSRGVERIQMEQHGTIRN